MTFTIRGEFRYLPSMGIQNGQWVLVNLIRARIMSLCHWTNQSNDTLSLDTGNDGEHGRAGSHKEY
jgi:hypothetical protein